MCFNRKKIQKLQESVNELTNIVKTQELNRLREESKEFDKVKELLSHVKLKIKDVKAFDGEELGKRIIRVTYKVPTVVLTFDNDGELNRDDFFYSSNMLEMIDIEDMKKIQAVINEEKNKTN